jgi:hypothetical protein
MLKDDHRVLLCLQRCDSWSTKDKDGADSSFSHRSHQLVDEDSAASSKH